MKKKLLLLNEELKRIVELSGDNILTGKHLVSVDIQPEYQNNIPWLRDFINFLNENYSELNKLTFFYRLMRKTSIPLG